MSTPAAELFNDTPDFCHGILHYGRALPRAQVLELEPAIPQGAHAVSALDDRVVHQTLLAADALRYLTLQVCASKASGHPGGFASSADAVAALIMLGHTNIVTEVGHHAPGYYSSMFLDRSLEEMGIYDVAQFEQRFREREGLLGHLSGAIPGLLAPAGPLGQGQHFAMAGALLHRDRLFPCTIGDGGMGEPYVLSAMQHFHTAYPEVTNFLPVLVWNGYSQEHHAMCSLHSNQEMTGYWQAHGFGEVVLVDAKAFDDAGQEGEYVDSTLFSHDARMAFTRAILEGADRAARSALGGTLTVLIVKQLKGAGVHATGAKAHNLYPGDTADKPNITAGLKRRALTPEAWALVRANFERAGGGPAARTSVTESELPLAELGELPIQWYPVGGKAVPATAMSRMVAEVGRRDPRFLVSNADGTEASAMKPVSEALTIRHPTTDALYHQGPTGQLYEPLNEDACAGLAAGLALFGSRTLWLSYESFAVNGWPIVQTVAQAMAELRRRTPSLVMMFTAGALEQGRNGWTHQRPEIEGYIGSQMRNGNTWLLYPCDANMIQAAYAWGTGSWNKAVAIVASKSPLPVHTTPEQARAGIEEGAVALYESDSGTKGTVVYAVTGDMILLPVFEARDKLEAQSYRVRIVSVANPRRLFRPRDIAWDSVSRPEGGFMSDNRFEQLFGGDALVGVSGGSTSGLEPVMLRSRAPGRDLVGWCRGETTASPGELMAVNGITADSLAQRAREALS